jgi:acyl carrier protein
MRDEIVMTDRLARLNEIFREVFEDDDLVVNHQTSAHDVEGWDSLMHVTLIVNVERAFGIRLRSAEVAGLKDVGELLDLIESHAGKAQR